MNLIIDFSLLTKKTGIKFFVECGVDVSLILDRCNDKISDDFKLYVANGTEVPCFGHRILTLGMGLRRGFQWPFITANINKGILDSDFLNQLKLLIDIKNQKLIVGVLELSIIEEIK